MVNLQTLILNRMKVFGSVVLIKPDRLPERTPSGALVIPENSTEMLPEWGTIVDLGSKCKTYKKGDHVYFPRKSASLWTIDGEDHFLVNEYRLFFGRETKTK